MSSIRQLNREEAQVYTEFYSTNFPTAEYFVISYTGQVLDRDFENYFSAYESALEVQDTRPDDIIDVWVKVRETVTSTVATMEAV